MEEKNKMINLQSMRNSILPFGYKEIHMTKIPPRKIEDKLLIYNKRYKYACYSASHPDKPVTKILK